MLGVSSRSPPTLGPITVGELFAMTESAIAVLRQLLAKPGEEHTQADLARAAGVPPATVGMTITRLVSIGWVTKVDPVGGTRPVRLTEDGVLGATVAVSRMVHHARRATVDGPAVTVSQLAEAVRRGDESPAVLAAVRRVMGHPTGGDR